MHHPILIFDLDGTLSDPFLGIFRCMNYALSSHDYLPRSESEIRTRIGPPLELTMAEFAETDDQTKIQPLVDTYRERYFAAGYAENQLYENVIPVLTQLQNSNVKMGVCTSKHPRAAAMVLEEFKLSEFFVFLSGAEKATSKAEQLQTLLLEKQIDGNAIMIGDRAIDLQAAKANSLRCAGVLWGFGDQQELEAEQPDFLLEKPADFLKLFD